MTLKTNRLSRLADLLERYDGAPNAPAFDLENWGSVTVKRRGFLWLQKAECHTHACAVGLACLSGAFAADGLTFKLDPDINGGLEPVFASHAGYPAVQAFFGLTEKQAANLFSVDAYDGATRGPEAAKAVAARIRALIVPKPKRVRKSKRTIAAVEKIKADALAGA